MRRPTPETLARYVTAAEREGKPVRSARVTPDGEIVLEFGQAVEANPWDVVDYGKARSA